MQGRAESALDDVDGFGPGPEPRRVDMGVAGKVQGGLLERGPQRFKLFLCVPQRGVKGLLIARVERLQIHRADGLFEHGSVGSDIPGQTRKQDGGSEKLDSQVVRIGPALGELDLLLCPPEGLFVDRGQKFDRDQHGVAGLCMIEENDGLKIVAHRHATAIQVDDLRHGPVRGSVKVEPDSGAGEVVSVQRGGHGDGATIPDGVGRGLGVGADNWPTRVIQIESFTMRKIPHMRLPSVRRQGVQTRQPLDCRPGLAGERAHNACGFLGGLCLGR